MNSQKRKGSDFERLATDTLNRLVKRSLWKRIPSSGALGTIMHEAILTSDINGIVDALPKKVKLEAKVGYGGATQFTLKKEWLDKVKEEANSAYAMPALIGKFSGAREGVKIFVVLPVEEFAYLLNLITDLTEELNDR